jgi:hypothetical protein
MPEVLSQWPTNFCVQYERRCGSYDLLIKDAECDLVKILLTLNE